MKYKGVVVCGIYKITSPSNKIYIGQSIDIYKRWRGYLKLHKELQAQPRLFNSFQKHGVENHKFEIIEECIFELLNEREAYWSRRLDTWATAHGMNVREPGGAKGRFSEESKKKLSSSQKERYKNGFVNWNKGKTGCISQEARMKMSIAHKGKIISAEHRKIISEASKNRKVSDHARQLIKERLSVRVYRYNEQGMYIDSFTSIQQASISCNLYEGVIRKSINKKIKTSTTSFYFSKEKKDFINPLEYSTSIRGGYKEANKLRIKCDYCDIITNKANLAKYHNDKCKFK